MGTVQGKTWNEYLPSLCILAIFLLAAALLLKYTHVLVFTAVLWLVWGIHRNLPEQWMPYSPFANPVACFFLFGQKEDFHYKEKYVFGLIIFTFCIFFSDVMTRNIDDFEKKQAYIVGYREHPDKDYGLRGKCGIFYVTLRDDTGKKEIYLTNIEMSEKFLNGRKFDVYIDRRNSPLILSCKWTPMIEGLSSNNDPPPCFYWRTLKVKIAYWSLLTLSIYLMSIYFCYKLRSMNKQSEVPDAG